MQFFYMLSRNRSTCGVRPYVRATTNPDATSWVAELIEWWVDQDTGYAIPERSGRLRWFVRDGDLLKWYDTEAAAQAAYPAIPAKSFTFIAASLADNPALEIADPGYRANLLALPLVEREQLLAGNWKIRPAAGKVFNRGWFEIVDAVPAGGLECDGWDFAATAKEQRGDDPDFTAGVGIRKVDGLWYVTWMHAEQVANADPLLRNYSTQNRARCEASGTQYRIRWEIEPAASGKKENRRLASMMAGYDGRGVRPGGDKLTRSRGLAAQAEAGNVKVLKAPWNEEFLQHMHAIPDGDHDDIHDAAALAFNGTNEAAWTAKSRQG
jgi:predicted phage terminase large subunit-like protein